MNIYKLKPLNSSYLGWRRSAYSKEVLVRAESEKDARIASKIAFGKMIKSEPGRDIPPAPWEDESHTSCEELHDSKYDQNGECEILKPEGWDTRFPLTK